MNESSNLQSEWRAMIHICHDFYFVWRQTVAEALGQEQATALARRFWEIVGQNTARVYQQQPGFDPHDLPALVHALARSSEIMGETVEASATGGLDLKHTHCPWYKDYQKRGLGAEDQAGCDAWFAATLATLSPRLRFETVYSFPAGDTCCLRRFWVEEESKIITGEA